LKVVAEEVEKHGLGGEGGPSQKGVHLGTEKAAWCGETGTTIRSFSLKGKIGATTRGGEIDDGLRELMGGFKGT